MSQQQDHHPPPPPHTHRFGSFEVCRSTDAATGRAGPSAGLAGTLLLPLLGHVIRAQTPALWSFYGGGDDISMAGVSDANVRVVKHKGGYWEVNRVAGTVCVRSKGGREH